MRRTRFIGWRTAALLAGAALLAPAIATAQEPDTERDRENCICFDRDDGPLAGATFLRGDRARIGVMLQDNVEVDGRTGVRIEEVLEDAPAHAAGLLAGDIITAIDGEALGEDAGEGLMEIMADIEPGETVEVTYYRDGDRRSVDIVTDRMDPFQLMRSGDGFDVRVAPRMAPGGWEDRVEGRLRRPSGMRFVTPGGFLRSLAPGGLDLVEMNPGLGEYFGTDEGVLVAEVDDASELGLRAGDVILAIDGREVRDAAHVRSILDSYRPDEEITFEIVREERTMEVTGTAH